jgi:hypothetical protein
MCRQLELLANQVKHILFGHGVGQVGIQKMLTQRVGRVLQLLDPKGTD